MNATATRIGILGRGQLARMLERAGQPLGQHFEFVDDPSARFMSGVEVVTFESENWSVRDVERAAAGVPVFPSTRALSIGQDRQYEKELFDRLGIATAEWSWISRGFELPDAVERVGVPSIVKTRRGGYDGRGQWTLRTLADIGRVAVELGERSAIVEQLVPFRRELSIVAARGADGAIVYYPLVENHHERGCLRITLAPARVDERIQSSARTMIRALLVELDYVGVLALELFEVAARDGTSTLCANEIAPRVHNSGHWTIEGSKTSQFENHLRAISGLPLGDTETLGPSAMLNLLSHLPELRAVLSVPGAHPHVYDKEPAPGRKLGHVTLRADTESELARRLDELSLRIDISLPEAVTSWIRSTSSG
ncbi:MAG: 5-(carboxyamino)imidazole ribonucleotide synthase [Planctomycetota bacterium]|nr:5-(carboxyamino)imidazole ribonucleotide synthase [Planctomycetota bacterium]